VKRSWQWLVPRARMADVFAWLEGFEDCTRGGFGDGPRTCVWAGWGCGAFLLPDLETGEPLPHQRLGRTMPLYMMSQFGGSLMAESRVYLRLLLPFAEPDAAARAYCRALLPEMPCVVDPAGFEWFVPRADRHGYERRRRLPPDWLAP
jgi:hypothetical protein